MHNSFGLQNGTSQPGESRQRAVHVLIGSTGLKICGAGQRLEEKHGVKARRQWHKLHLAVDADTGEILAEVLTDQSISDISQLEALLEQIDIPITSFTGDGAYDSDETYQAARRHSTVASIIIPPRMRKPQNKHHGPSDQRNWHTNAIAHHGRMRWQSITGYGRRAKAETSMGRYKSIIGNRLRSRKLANQKTEVILGCRILNRMLNRARPNSVRVTETTA
ncbi:hypothetical protein FHS77_002660 [Paenochrobactrum gallinarii]|uniref:Transposase IS4-like domain-containing protein n=1 Tax=Paenochrobactrum gallinarii TaxID=643673 RepID=A0A841M000_9HYPH|nr:hypothetical protein [Paenochrobactrum gallinarii]